jgi:Protein of unknown function (DUF2934)
MKTPIPSSAGERRPSRAGAVAAREDQSVESVSGAHVAGHRNGSRMDRIAERAHEIYERRGGENGKALDDWLQAEREIDEEL